MNRALIFLIGAFLFSLAALVDAQPVAVKAADVKWTDMKGAPAGWRHAILVGDPDKSGPYVERIRVPANAKIPPHSHPDTENITVLAGSFGIGEGDKFDKSKGTTLSVGSFYMLPGNTVHYAWSGPKGVTLQIHGVGPTGIKMVEQPKQ